MGLPALQKNLNMFFLKKKCHQVAGEDGYHYRATVAGLSGGWWAPEAALASAVWGEMKPPSPRKPSTPPTCVMQILIEGCLITLLGHSLTPPCVFSITLGGFGADRFYLGQWREGLGKLFSFGGLGIWTLIDVLLIGVGYVGPADGSLYI